MYDLNYYLTLELEKAIEDQIELAMKSETLYHIDSYKLERLQIMEEKCRSLLLSNLNCLQGGKLC